MKPEFKKIAESLGIRLCWKNSPLIWTSDRMVQEFGGSEVQNRKRLDRAAEKGDWIKGCVRINGKTRVAYAPKDAKLEFE